MLGTNRPSITSTWIQSAPDASTARTSSPNRVKSAASIEGATRIGCMVPPRSVLTNGCRVDEPDQLTKRPDASSRCLAGTCADRTENRCLLLARHQKSDPTAALDHRIGHRDADLRSAV